MEKLTKELLMRKHDKYVDIYSSSGSKRKKKKENLYQQTENDIYSYSNKKTVGKNQYKGSNKKHYKQKSKKKKHPIRRTILIILALVLAVFVGLCIYIFSGLNTSDITTDPSELGIRDGYESHGVENIALFGVDSRDSSDTGRSDAIMILSVDKWHNSIKISSLLRDSRVKIDGHGYDKLAHAYAYGGPTLAMKTINQNFDLDVQEYITVNFEQLADIIDAVGGIDLTITEEERVATNGILASTPGITTEEIKSSGTVHLNGQQATAYARIRKLDSDSMRASRQQTVLETVFNKIMDLSPLEYPSFIKDMLSLVETSLSYGDILSLAPVMLFGKPEFESTTVPNDEDGAAGQTISGVWYWDYDIDEAAERLHMFIYGES